MVWITDAVLAMVLIEDVLTSLMMIELSWYMCVPKQLEHYSI